MNLDFPFLHWDPQTIGRCISGIVPGAVLVKVEASLVPRAVRAPPTRPVGSHVIRQARVGGGTSCGLFSSAVLEKNNKSDCAMPNLPEASDMARGWFQLGLASGAPVGIRKSLAALPHPQLLSITQH